MAKRNSRFTFSILLIFFFFFTKVEVMISIQRKKVYHSVFLALYTLIARLFLK
jgi:hypothetical protein